MLSHAVQIVWLTLLLRSSVVLVTAVCTCLRAVFSAGLKKLEMIGNHPKNTSSMQLQPGFAQGELHASTTMPIPMFASV